MRSITKRYKPGLVALLLAGGLSGCFSRPIQPLSPATYEVAMDYATEEEVALPFYPQSQWVRGRSRTIFSGPQPLQRLVTATLRTPAPLEEVAAFYERQLQVFRGVSRVRAQRAAEPALAFTVGSFEDQRWVRLQRHQGETLIVLGRCRDESG